ncbi:PREDICTED: zinc finger protein 260-like [Nicrophorus vespilloides]|uniref:Zinc finger protein 260-like n=1 Tax=Nicrophorus vespilloides TaxID=110193 RepID=A0ABM1NHG7_NICVS|nr:PREDICTED: zinc finger protein 260-like [Nicrophorus vespilloides]
MATVDTTRYVDLCRLCATKTNMVMGLSIFDSEGSVRQIYKKIETCLPVQIHENDNLPKMICDHCLYKLEMLFDFHQRSLRTESILVDLFKELSQQVKMDDVSLEHSNLVMVHHQGLLSEHGMPHMNELNEHELEVLTNREHIIAGHEIIQNVSLDNIELSNHELNHELSNHSEGMLQTARYPDTIAYHHHHILPEQYNLNDITLSAPSLEHSPEINTLKEMKSDTDCGLLIEEKSLLHVAEVDEGELENNSNETNFSFYCNLCGTPFEDKEDLDKHYLEHYHKCSVCLASFAEKEDLIAHEKDHQVDLLDEKAPSPVPIEEKRPSTDKEISDFENNLDEEPIEEEDSSGGTGKKKKWTPKVCKECGKSYKTNYKLAEHMRKHTGEQPFKCQSCDKAFRSKIGLAQHEAKHTGQYDYACLTCGKGFQCKSYLMVHQRVHSDEKPYPCTTCGRNFKTKQSLLDHTNRHLGVKPYTCDICGRSFITNGLLKSHQKIHSGTDNRKYLCKVCDKRFVSKSYLQTHLRIHTGEKPFMCEVCGKGFLTRVDLKIHSTMHTGEKSYVCEMCGKAFARRDALRCHRRSHTGERPYSCDICGQTFTQFSPMAIHRRLHTGERPYECETCGKKFVSRSTMVVHSKKHTR